MELFHCENCVMCNGNLNDYNVDIDRNVIFCVKHIGTNLMQCMAFMHMFHRLSYDIKE